MKSITHKIRELARSKVRARITHQTRSQHGYIVRINGEVVHHCPTHKEAVAFLIARLTIAPRLTMEVRPGTTDDYRCQVV